MKKLKIFCFPYAGGSANIYQTRNKSLQNANLEFELVELARSGRRIYDDLYDGVPAMVEDVYSKIVDQLEEPYAFFGHSMGSMLAYELYQLLRQRGKTLPSHVFFSGRAAPIGNREGKKKFSQMNDEEFKNEVIELGGTPKEFFSNPELMEIFLPVLRNDFRLSEESPVHTNPNPLACDISVFVGTDEGLTEKECTDWEMHTIGTCNLHYIEGDHFFLHPKQEEVIQHIERSIIKVLQPAT